MNRSDEQQRILELVESGKVTPEEGERLLASLEQRSRGHQQCPFCAESIPSETTLCPECGSALGANHASPAMVQNGSGFHALGGLGKFLVCYTFLVCGLMWLLSLGHFRPSIALLLAALGIVAAVLICKGSRTGWVLGTLWAGVQILPIVAAGAILNRQILHLGILSTTNGSGIGFNLVGVILLILFIKATPRDPKPKLHERR
ncbi:MAG: hypothetical protein KAU94_10865 [Verrucomicrobia bacterium]|nr:hypothetical protein [Verrucomicrobiota bacterium]